MVRAAESNWPQFGVFLVGRIPIVCVTMGVSGRGKQALPRGQGRQPINHVMSVGQWSHTCPHYPSAANWGLSAEPKHDQLCGQNDHDGQAGGCGWLPNLVTSVGGVERPPPWPAQSYQSCGAYGQVRTIMSLWSLVTIQLFPRLWMPAINVSFATLLTCGSHSHTHVCGVQIRSSKFSPANSHSIYKEAQSYVKLTQYLHAWWERMGAGSSLWQKDTTWYRCTLYMILVNEYCQCTMASPCTFTLT